MQRLIIGAVLALILCLAGCATNIAKIKENPEMYYEKEVSVKGVAKNSMKLGELSGFGLFQGNDSILVSSKGLPPDNTQVVVKGKVKPLALLGKTYPYLEAESVH